MYISPSLFSLSVVPKSCLLCGISCFMSAVLPSWNYECMMSKICANVEIYLQGLEHYLCNTWYYALQMQKVRGFLFLENTLLLNLTKPSITLHNSEYIFWHLEHRSENQRNLDKNSCCLTLFGLLLVFLIFSNSIFPKSETAGCLPKPTFFFGVHSFNFWRKKVCLLGPKIKP